jgi:hypothetical protein
MPSILLRLLSLCAVPLACWTTGARAADIPFLVIERQVAPYQINTPGQPMAGGLVTEVVQALLRGSAHKLQPVMAPWLRLEAMIKHGQLKGWVGYGWMQQLRSGTECAPTPIAPWRTVLAALAGKRLPTPLTLEALQTLHLLLVRGYDYPGLDAHLQSRSGGPIHDQRTQTPEAALKMLMLGRGDAVIEEQLRLRHVMREQGVLDGQLQQHDLSAIVPPQQLCLLVDAAMAEPLKRELFERLARLARSGELARIVARYQ